MARKDKSWYKGAIIFGFQSGTIELLEKRSQTRCKDGQILHVFKFLKL